MQSGRLLKLALGIALIGVPGWADVIIDFAGGGAAGTAGHIIGTGTCGVGPGCSVATSIGILIDEVTGNVASSPGGTTGHAVTNGVLEISASNGAFLGGVYTYHTGTFEIKGGVPDAGIADGTTLESGAFGTLSVNLAGGVPRLNLVVDGGDSKDPDLVAYLCPSCATNSWTVIGGTSKLANITGGGGSGYTADTFSTDIPNHYVPEPASIILLGTTLVGLTHLIRRRTRRT